jgi:hypothetical protein
MKINKLNIHGGNVTIADVIGKISYSQTFGLTEEQFKTLIAGIRNLSADDQSALKKDFVAMNSAQTTEEKTSVAQRIGNFLTTHGIPVAQSFTGTALFEFARYFNDILRNIPM